MLFEFKSVCIIYLILMCVILNCVHVLITLVSTKNFCKIFWLYFSHFSEFCRHSAHSANSERSPSTKQRALPDIPAGEDGVYDQLERELPTHQMRAKSSESTSVKNKQPKAAATQVGVQPVCWLQTRNVLDLYIKNGV